MLEKLQMYINGEWVDSHSTETIEVMNPWMIPFLES